MADPPLKPLPVTEDPPLVRTDFADNAAWGAVCEAINEPDAAYRDALEQFAELQAALGQAFGDDVTAAPVAVIDDPAYDGVTTERLLQALPDDYPHTFLFLVDRATLTQPDQPIVVVDLFDQRGRTFRTVPAQVHAIASNLSIANTDWEDFTNLIGDDGVFRGFEG